MVVSISYINSGIILSNTGTLVIYAILVFQKKFILGDLASKLICPEAPISLFSISQIYRNLSTLLCTVTQRGNKINITDHTVAGLLRGWWVI